MWPLQSNFLDLMQPLRIVFSLLTGFGIQRNSWCGDGCSSSAHMHHKQKGHKIFMQLKQGWEVQCKQIN